MEPDTISQLPLDPSYSCPSLADSSICSQSADQADEVATMQNTLQDVGDKLVDSSLTSPSLPAGNVLEGQILGTDGIHESRLGDNTEKDSSGERVEFTSVENQSTSQARIDTVENMCSVPVLPSVLLEMEAITLQTHAFMRPTSATIPRDFEKSFDQRQRHACQDTFRQDDLEIIADELRSSSLPPSSSPAHVFSSSPLASSQSSQSPSSHPLDEVTSKGKCIETEEDALPVASSEVDFAPWQSGDRIDDYMLDVSELQTSPAAVVSNSSKRTFREALSAPQTGSGQVSPFPKRVRTDLGGPEPPAPKRLTLVSQKEQYRKLIAPFRSPLLLSNGKPFKPSNMGPKSTAFQKPEQNTPHPSCRTGHLSGQVHSGQQPISPCTKVMTSKAAAQFKSPVIRSSDGPSYGRPAIRLTPKIQTLEHKLQLLRRAVKVKEDQDEEILEKLVKKWTEAGREAAYQLWDLVKDAGEVPTKSSDFASFWSRTTATADWGWDKPADQEESTDQYKNARCTWQIEGTVVCEEDGPPRTLGTMLRELRIDPATLCWDEETETFLD
ncbi:hypothetical protein ID866_8248 [Astraeus odoratus]|nr:hypothetical protein ID866_8248 [Astraeus odoratus]